LNLLNSHGDPTCLRAVLSYHIERQYVPAPKANFARVVINGENWGIYENVEQFNKDFVKEWFRTTKGARWKVPGSPGGRGSLAYLGDDVSAYKKIYDMKTKKDDKAWADLVHLCKVLNETPAEDLEKALEPILDIDGALKFLALENVLINNDGYWIRTSDYSIYQEPNGRFHILPQDSNETFVRPGGPGFGGGPGGRRGFGPGMIVAEQMLSQGDKNSDGKLTKPEIIALAEVWFGKLDVEKSGKVDQEQFVAKLGEILLRPGGGPGRFNDAPLFTALDANKDGSLTRTELKETFEGWFSQWDAASAGSLNEEQLRNGLAAVLPRPNFGGPGGGRGPGGPGGGPGPGGPGGPGGNMPRVEGVKLDPLVAANDPNKPLISKLLAVPALRARYLAYVRVIADKWLDWSRLGPIAQQYHDLIAEEVKADTRKLDSYEAFEKGVLDDSPGGEGFGGGGRIGIKSFADQRRAFLLEHPEVKKNGK
jgi:hypothetical protein